MKQPGPPVSTLIRAGNQLAMYRTKWVGLGITALAAVLSGFALLAHRHHRMVTLYHSSMWGSTGEATVSLTELARFRGWEAEELLLRVASPKARFFDHRQELAVQFLAKGKDPLVAERLSEYLKPQTALSLRSAVSKALQEMECDLTCTRSVLHYLERMSWGELNFEEAFEHDPNLRSILRPEQDQVVNNLHQVLWKDQGVTIEVLTQDYGLGSDYPSRFALRLVASLKLKSACPALGKSLAKTLDPALRAQIDAMASELRCSASPSM
jgi:hypothetical protein